MIEKPTLFILGAGASKPYDIPTAAELLEGICAGRDGSSIRNMYSEGDWNIMGGRIETFLDELRESKCVSIDEFLRYRTDHGIIGRRLIAAGLVPRESPELLLEIGRKGDWYKYLLDKMKAETLDEFARNQVAFVSLNYDRSLEHVMTVACSRRYKTGLAESWKSVRQIRIEHPYGVLGPYTSDRNDYGDCRPYESVSGKTALQIAAQHIKIIPDDRAGHDKFIVPEDLICWAETVVILGFGFEETNTQRLGLHRLEESKPLHASAYDVRRAEKVDIVDIVSRGIGFGEKGVGCLDFLREQVALR